uniref:Uncharacterized protein n=1 Tax=Magallana gigas TaxID=29159 RepID=K1QIY7_MAGGI
MAEWVSTIGSNITDNAMCTGHKADKKPLFIARTIIQDEMTPGKCGTNLKVAFIPYDGKENITESYEVLVERSTS